MAIKRSYRVIHHWPPEPLSHREKEELLARVLKLLMAQKQQKEAQDGVLDSQNML